MPCDTAIVSASTRPTYATCAVSLLIASSPADWIVASTASVTDFMKEADEDNVVETIADVEEETAKAMEAANDCEAVKATEVVEAIEAMNDGDETSAAAVLDESSAANESVVDESMSSLSLRSDICFCRSDVETETCGTKAAVEEPCEPIVAVVLDKAFNLEFRSVICWLMSETVTAIAFDCTELEAT